MNRATVETPELLESIAAGAGCMYLSDLHLPAFLCAVQHFVRGLDPSRYSLWEWNDAVRYITGSAAVFDTPEQAAQYLSTYSEK